MSSNDADRDKSPVTTDRIDGPIPEYDRFDQYTGYDYYRCRDCGRDSITREGLAGCCE